MRGNSFGKLFTITSFGESHGEALGVIIDGMPAGVEISLIDLQNELDRRRPGRLKETTSRTEDDRVKVLSGIFENKTLGTPIMAMVENTNQMSKDYDKLKNHYRPGHADKTTIDKFGVRDHRGGGRASGRETLARVIGGYFAGLIIKDIQFQAKITRAASFDFTMKGPTDSKFGLYSGEFDNEFSSYLLDLKEHGQSIGGEVRLSIQGVPSGLGEPVFDKLKAELSHAFMSIGSCMGVNFGLGEKFITTHGKEISTNSKNFSGIEGGISNGEEVYAHLIFKAPSTVGEKAKEGRHDPCILPRVIPVIEAMAKIVIADQFLRQKAYQI